MTRSWRRMGATLLAASATLALTAQLATAQVNGFSKNQLLKLPLTAGKLPVQFIVRGLEPSNRTDNQGTIYISSIPGVPGGGDAYRWSPIVDPPPNPDGTLPFNYLGQPHDSRLFANA